MKIKSKAFYNYMYIQLTQFPPRSGTDPYRGQGRVYGYMICIWPQGGRRTDKGLWSPPPLQTLQSQSAWAGLALAWWLEGWYWCQGSVPEEDK